MESGFDWQALFDERQAIFAGVLTTLGLFFASSFLALILGFVLAFGEKSRLKPIHLLSRGYIQFFRNTPLLVHLYFFYKALPYMGLVWPAWVCGLLALTLQAAAYTSEIFRTGMEAIPREQLEGGMSLGLTRLQAYCKIIFPQMLGITLPPMGNQLVAMMKNTALVAFITVPDLFLVISQAGAAHFRYVEFFTLGIVIYMLLTLAVSGVFILLERLPLVQRTREAAYV